jgi:hypothetical protein
LTYSGRCARPRSRKRELGDHSGSTRPPFRAGGGRKGGAAAAAHAAAEALPAVATAGGPPSCEYSTWRRRVGAIAAIGGRPAIRKVGTLLGADFGSVRIALGKAA